MRLRGRAAASILVAIAAAAARADDPADAAQRARAVVGGVFSSPEFAPLAEADRIPHVELPDVDLTWMQRLAKWFSEVLRDVLHWLFDVLEKMFGGMRRLFGGGGAAGEASGQMARIVGWVLGAVALALIVWLVVRLLRASAAERRARATAIVGGAPDAEDDALSRTPDEWRRSAAALADGGRRREAIRALYLSLLASLHAAGAIDYDRTRTNTAYVGDLRSDHSARPAFVSLTQRFDVSWYGHHEPADADIDAAVAETESVMAAFAAEAVHA